MPAATTPDFLTPAREIVAGQRAILDGMIASKRNGHAVCECWSEEAGGYVPHFPVETVEDCAARLAREAVKHAEFRASPRGRFMTAIGELEALGAYPVETQRLRGYYDRSITTLNGPNLTPGGVAAVAECIVILSGIVGRDARAGVDALCSLLVAEGPKLREAA